MWKTITPLGFVKSDVSPSGPSCHMFLWIKLACEQTASTIARTGSNVQKSNFRGPDWKLHVHLQAPQQIYLFLVTVQFEMHEAHDFHRAKDLGTDFACQRILMTSNRACNSAQGDVQRDQEMNCVSEVCLNLPTSLCIHPPHPLLHPSLFLHGLLSPASSNI